MIELVQKSWVGVATWTDVDAFGQTENLPTVNLHDNGARQAIEDIAPQSIVNYYSCKQLALVFCRSGLDITSVQIQPHFEPSFYKVNELTRFSPHIPSNSLYEMTFQPSINLKSMSYDINFMTLNLASFLLRFLNSFLTFIFFFLKCYFSLPNYGISDNIPY